MTTILKKEWAIGFWIILLVFLCMTIVTISGISPVLISIFGGLFLFSYLVQVDERSKMNVHLASLAIDRKTIVRGRYLFFALFMLVMVASGFLFNKLTPFALPQGVFLEPISLTKSVLILALFLFLISILLPIFYYFRYNVATLITMFFVIPSSVILLVILGWEEGSLSNWLSQQTLISKFTLLTLGFVLLVYWLSYKLSVAIFQNKDLHA